jgi:DNA-binding XRE family transcriptional regulator
MARDFTQERLAELVDLNIRTVQKIEGGEINILLTTALRFQRVLKCPWDQLMPSPR